VHGAAPGANIVYVGSVDNDTSLDIAFFNTLYNHVADVVTDSWGDNGESIAPGSQASYDQAAMAGAAQGITVLFSSGDDGDLSAPNGVASGAWPATSAYVTGVGGTTLELKNSNGVKSEYGWGTYRAFLDDVTVNSAISVTTSGVAQTTAFGQTFDDYSFYSGSGGGISLLETQPAYQAAAVPVALATTLNLGSGYTEPRPCVSVLTWPWWPIRTRDIYTARRSRLREMQSPTMAARRFPRPRNTARARSAAPASRLR